MIHHHTLPVTRTARYCRIGRISPAVRELWLCCHGYGQLARRFARPFEVLEAEHRLLLFPEGLSRFYWGKFTGPPVASWMTKEDRLDEIADYSAYLSNLLAQYREQLAPGVRVTVFGFSQGVQTIFRWLLRERPDFHHLVAYAGTTPEDLDYRAARDYLADKTYTFAYSPADPLFTAARHTWQRDFAREAGLPFRWLTYEGAHEVTAGALRAIAGGLPG